MYLDLSFQDAEDEEKVSGAVDYPRPVSGLFKGSSYLGRIFDGGWPHIL